MPKEEVKRRTQLDLFEPMPVRPIVPEDARASGLSIDARFHLFNRLNPHVYDELARMARELHERGRKRIGIKMLWEVLRWRHFLTTSDPESEFKLCNDYYSRYARLILQQEKFPEGLFELRELRSRRGER